MDRLSAPHPNVLCKLQLVYAMPVSPIKQIPIGEKIIAFQFNFCSSHQILILYKASSFHLLGKRKKNDIREGLPRSGDGSIWIVHHVYLPSLPAIQMPKAAAHNRHWLREQ